jgi:hypothetical protein
MFFLPSIPIPNPGQLVCDTQALSPLNGSKPAANSLWQQFGDLKFGPTLVSGLIPPSFFKEKNLREQVRLNKKESLSLQ